MTRSGDPEPPGDGPPPSVETRPGEGVWLPDGFALFDAAYARSGADLVATAPDGATVVVPGFFAAADPPMLVSTSGARIAGELIAGLADARAPRDLDEALFGTRPAPAGTVDGARGTSTVIRADGTRLEAADGDSVYPGDGIETGADGSGAIGLADAVVIGLGPESRLTVGLVDATAEATVPVALAAGTVAVACGTAPRPLRIDTPAARIEADGARLLVAQRPDGTLEVVLVPQEDGGLGRLAIGNAAGTLVLDRPYQLVVVDGASPPTHHGTASIDVILATWGPVLRSLPVGCGVTPPLAAARIAGDDPGPLSAEALDALAAFETAAGDEAEGGAAAPDGPIVVTAADPLAASPEPITLVAPSLPPQPGGTRTTGGGSDGADTGNEQLLSSLAARQTPPRPNFERPPDVAPPIAVGLTVADWDIRTWTTLVPQHPSPRQQSDLYRVLFDDYDEPEPFVSMPLAGQGVRRFAASDGPPMVLMAAGPMGGPVEIGRGVEIEDVENPKWLGLPTGSLAREIAGAIPIDGAVMWAVRSVAAGTTIRFDWMFDGRDEANFDDFAAFAVVGGDQTSVYELARNADVGGFGATGWRTSEWTFLPADGATRTLKLGFVVMNDADDANEPRLLIDNMRVDKPIEGDVQPLGAPQTKALGTLVTYGPVPTAGDDALTTDEDSALTIAAGTLLANDVTPTGLGSLSIIAVDATATLGRVTLGGSGTIVYDPRGRFDPLAAGDTAVDTFRYTVSDGNGATASALVTVTIVGINDPPQARDDAVTTSEKAVVVFDPAANDSDPDGGPLRVSAIDATGARGVVTLADDRTVAYDPAGRFDGLRTGETATDRFTYTLDDGFGGTATARVTVTITGVNDPPVAVDDIATTDEKTAVAIVVTANDRDPEGTPLRLAAVDIEGTIGRVTIGGAGTVIYDPAGRFDGLGSGAVAIDRFAYTIDDGDGGSARATVTVTVHGVNDPPVAVADAFTTDEDTAFTLPVTRLLANDFDPDAGDALAVTAVDGSAAKGVVSLDAAGQLTYDPGDRFQSLRAGQLATDRFTYTIGDGRGGIASAAVTVTVVGVNDAPIARDDTALTDRLSAVRIAPWRLLLNDSDPDDGETPLLRVIEATPTETTVGTVRLNVDGSVTYDPAGGFPALAFGATATDSFRYTIADGSGGTASATVTVTVTGRNQAPTSSGELITSFEGVGAPALPAEWDRIQPLRPGPEVFQPVAVVSRYDETDGRRGSFVPTDGDHMALLEAFGSFADPPRPVADFLGVAPSQLPRDGDFSDPKDGAAMKTTILVRAGDVISFDWMFDARDTTGPGVQAFNDFAVFTVAGEGGSQVFKLSDVRATGDFGATGWRTSKVLMAADGLVTIGFAVVNDEVAHGIGSARNSRLLVDNVRLNRELGDDFQLLAGQPGGVFQTWVLAPTAAADAVTIGEDSVLTLAPAALLANDSPPAVGGTLSVVDLDPDLATGAVGRIPGGAIVYDPRGRFDHLREGETATDSFLYTIAADNGGTAVGRVTVTVTGVNDPPAAAPDAFATNEDTVVAGDVLADNGAGADRDPEGDALTVIRVDGSAAAVGRQIALASGALLVLRADGTFLYDPAGRFEALKPGQTAIDGFTYTIDDGHGGTATAAVTVTIAGVNDPPVAVDDVAATDEDTALVLAPAANDRDPDGDALTVTTVDGTGTVGAVTLNPDGTLGYDPRGRFDFLAAGETATDRFAYTISDGAGGGDGATVTVTVHGLNDVPIAALDVAATDAATAVTIDVLANDVDPDRGDTLTVAALDVTGTQGTVRLNPDGSVDYDPAGRFDGLRAGETAIDRFAYTVVDGHGAAATATVTVTVSGRGGDAPTPGTLLDSFEAPFAVNGIRGTVERASRYDEPDGARGQFLPTDGDIMAVLRASGALPDQIASFLGLGQQLPRDGDGSAPADGAALRLTVAVRAGDRVSFDWMFDANDIVATPLGDFIRPGLNDYAVFAAEGALFKLSDVRETGSYGATGWRSSVYTAQADGPLIVGFAVLNDANSSFDSHLLIDNVRLARDFGDGYQVVSSEAGGVFETLVAV